MPPVRGRFDPTRFMMNQFSAFTIHTPVRRTLFAAYSKYIGTTGDGGLSTTATTNTTSSSNVYGSNGTSSGEGEEEYPDRDDWVIFAVRAPRGVVTGTLSGAWNAIVGTVGAPIVTLYIFLSCILGVNSGSPVKGALWGIVAGPLYGIAFAALGYITGVQQVSFGILNGIRGPLYAVTAIPTMKLWSAASCTFIEPRVAPQPYVSNYRRSSSDILFDAMKRNTNRKNKKNDEEEETQSESGFTNTYKQLKEKEKKGDYYSLLGVSKNSSAKEIRTAYSKRALELHPDKNPSLQAHEQFDTLTKAYKTLTNEEKRKRYDASGTVGDNTDRSKRSVLRMFFGGDDLLNLIGDVRKNSFNRRFIDDCDFGGRGGLKDLAVLNERIEDASCFELVNVYLNGYPSTEGNTFTQSEQNQRDKLIEEWQNKVQILIQRYDNIGLSKEVMYTAGKQYQLTCDIVDGSPITRAVLFSTTMTSNYVQRNGQKAIAITRISPSVSKDPSVVLDLIWKMSVTEIEQTAHRVAIRCLLDVDASPAERARRLAALRDFSSMLINAGKRFEAIDKGVMDKMVESMQRHQSNKHR